MRSAPEHAWPPKAVAMAPCKNSAIARRDVRARRRLAAKLHAGPCTRQIPRYIQTNDIIYLHPRVHHMGFKQTDTHRYGKGSYHQIGLVRGQFGNVPMDGWVKFLQDAGFDGWEEASWELDLAKCDTDAGAEAYAKERVALAKKHGLEIFTVATHLQGQALGDEPSAKTLNFLSPETEARKAYKAWRDKGNKPPRTNPFHVPEEVGKLVHQQAQKDL